MKQRLVKLVSTGTRRYLAVVYSKWKQEAGITWEGSRWGRGRHSDGHANTSTATVLSAAAATAAGVAASTAPTAGGE